jgi:hypothetical protein
MQKIESCNEKQNNNVVEHMCPTSRSSAQTTRCIPYSASAPSTTNMCPRNKIAETISTPSGPKYYCKSS